MDDEVPKEVNYDIFPGKLILGTLAIFSELITLSLAILLLEGTLRVIAVSTILTLTLTVILVQVFLRLRQVRKLYNLQSRKLNSANDNRNTLKLMVEEKNSEIDIHKNEIAMLKAQGALLFSLVYSKEKPEKNIVRQALRIEQDGVINSDE